MKIISTRNSLLEAINTVQKAVPSKTTLPILEGILFEARNGKLKLIATDLEIGIETTINVDVIVPGKIVISAKTIGDIFRKLPDSDVEIEITDNNTIYIKCENSKLKIMGVSSEEFPSLTEVDKNSPISFTQATLKDMIRQTLFATSTDEIRPVLTGVLFEVVGEKVSFIALDGFRMAVKWCSCINDMNIKAVVPGKTLSEISKIINDNQEKIDIFFSKNHIMFETGDTVIVSRLLDGEFINYKQLLPSDYKIRVKVPTSKLMESCERAALFAKDSKNNMIKFEINDELMAIKSNSDTGDVHEEIKISKTGEDIEIAFNAKYFIDALKVIQSDEIYIDFNTNVSPSIMRPVKETDFLYLILPVRLKK